MKRITIVLLFGIIFNLSYSQTLKNVLFPCAIDTLNIIPVTGYVTIPEGRNFVPNDSLNAVLLGKIKTIIPVSAHYPIKFLDDKYELSDSLKKYFVRIIPTISNLSEEVFSKIPIGDNFKEMINGIPGRYFGIIFYKGFVQVNLGKKFAKSMALGVATAALTGGLFAVVSAPMDPYLITDVVLIDKTNNCFLFYRRRLFIGFPLNDKKLHKNFRKIFEGYAPFTASE